jgi:ankyrin repeat protein
MATGTGIEMAGSELHVAAEQGSAEVVREIARRVTDVDAEFDGRSALWQAVHAGRLDNARALVEAGANPWRPMMAGWSPGRLALAGGTPDLFGPPPGGQALSSAEAAVVQEAERLKAAVSEPEYDGMSICCVSAVDAAEALRRLDASVIELDEAEVARLAEDGDSDAAELVLGITDVPGGCVVAQPWAYGASMPVVSERLSKGTVCYAMYDNPKSGQQGSSFRDGVTLGWDLSTGNGWSEPTDSAEDILLTYLYQDRPFAYCYAYAGVKPLDDRPLTGVPDYWVRLPDGDYWGQ